MGLPLLRTAIGSVLPLTTVATWNNFFILTVSCVSMVLLVAAFLSPQKYWQGGLPPGSVR